LSAITTDYIHKASRFTKLGVAGISVGIFSGLFILIHLQGQGIIMTLRRIWSIEPYKSTGDYELSYDYYEDDKPVIVRTSCTPKTRESFIEDIFMYPF